MTAWTFPLVQLFKKDPDSEQLTIYPCFLNLSALSTSSKFMAILLKNQGQTVTDSRNLGSNLTLSGCMKQLLDWFKSLLASFLFTSTGQ